MFSAAYKRYALGALTAVYMLNLVDRALIILLLQPIKEDLHLTDTQLGFVTGIAFGLFYAVLGLPIARWADRGNRVTVASVAIGLWGITVMASVLVVNYAQLVLARIAAAVGESGCKPPTYSLVGDYFPNPGERTAAMAVYLTGSPLATLVSFVLGGWLNELYGWRMTFFIMGVPGLVLAILVKLTVREPRMQRSASSAPARTRGSMKTAFITLFRQPSLRNLSIALILLYTMSLGLGPWYAAFMMRSHAMGTAELGVWLGSIFSGTGIIGILLGGYLANRWFQDDERSQMRWSAVALALVVPGFIAFLTVPGKLQALLTLIPMGVVFSIFLGPTYALMQRLVVDDMRATMMATVMLVANLTGMGIGPFLVGVLSDWLMPRVGQDSLRYAMLAVSFVALWAAYHFWKVGATVKNDLHAVAMEKQSRSEIEHPQPQASSLLYAGNK